MLRLLLIGLLLYVAWWLMKSQLLPLWIACQQAFLAFFSWMLP